MKKTTNIIIIGVLLIILVFLVFIIKGFHDGMFKHERRNIIESDFNLEVLKKTNEFNDDNYLISPYSMEVALSMLKDGANGDTKNQIERVIGNSTPSIKNDSVHIANGIFIKDEYKDVINNQYVKQLQDNRSAQVLYDKFDTPTVINNWVKENTKGMIPSIMDDISKDFVLGLANAIAIDVEWETPFNGDATRQAEFTKKDGTKMNVNMMHNEYSQEGSIEYIKSDKAQGVIIPYKEKTDLEYVAIMPNGDIDDYIKNLSAKEFEKLDGSKRTASKDLHINLGLPKYSYSYDFSKFMDMLKSIGISDVFNATRADLTNIMPRDYMTKKGIENLYVSTAIHKTYIDLNEKGTKAAAVTYFGIDKALGIREEYETINISFNKPFLYMIRDKKNNVVLFTGVVNTPSEYVKQPRD